MQLADIDHTDLGLDIEVDHHTLRSAAVVDLEEAVAADILLLVARLEIAAAGVVEPGLFS